MASKRTTPAYRCTECGWTAIKWVGRCGECQAWGTVAEVGEVKPRTTPAAHVARPAQPIGEVDATRASARPTGVGEFDRVLGGGLVTGAVVLVAGEPGIGKSTLLLDVAARAAREDRQVLYVSGEESAAQVRLRAERIEALARTLYLAAETDLATVLAQVDQVKPTLLIIDSVQTIASADIEGAPGNVGQIREVAASIIQIAKERGISVLLVGHVTKDGSIAGPRVLEHLVDVVVQFEGERHSRLRMVRAVKNRFGPTDEVGCFDLSDVGIVGLPDPSGLFLSRSPEPIAGTCVTVTLEGRRPLVTEVQALVAPGAGGSPRRTTSGVESSRTAMILAVLERHARLSQVRQSDCYVSTVGGVRVAEPAADLALALAMAGSALDRPLPAQTLAVGEVGLAGEVRPVGGVSRRLAEAARVGFTRAIIPVGCLDGSPPAGMTVREVTDIATAVRLIDSPGRPVDSQGRTSAQS
ncbi:DNA repair protein RadA [Calidifontibacter sp. DB0510]|uniref:DNA repair protein RadA n=1 Tax=Metallococcus carri TaxID=1656884 RepID=A0A967E8L1_9MICO|nr:DNA repair protein RadA [Metallococcus carri]NHN55337.1 DNA repair protein RadA [Metallococcus carri]NOP36414.1 DNA repair protein RadA [Calidifontibacter sp. DB2511S]